MKIITRAVAIIVVLSLIVLPATTQAAGVQSGKKPVKKGYGYLLIFKDSQSQFKRSIIKYAPPVTDQKCRGKVLTAANHVHVTLKKDKPQKYKCQPATYRVYFLTKQQKLKDLKKGKVKTVQVVPLKANQCAFVRSSGPITYSEIGKNDKCNPAN